MATCAAMVVRVRTWSSLKKRSARVFKIEDADDAFLVEEGNNELGARFGIHGQIALILAHVGDIDGAPFADGGADQAGW